MEILAYFFGPVGVLLAINLLFFAVTARELTCGLWKGEFVKSTTERWVNIPEIFTLLIVYKKKRACCILRAVAFAMKTRTAFAKIIRCVSHCEWICCSFARAPFANNEFHRGLHKATTPRSLCALWKALLHANKNFAPPLSLSLCGGMHEAVTNSICVSSSVAKRGLDADPPLRNSNWMSRA